MRQIDADVIALQEVETLHDEPGLLDYLCEDSPWQHIHGPTLERDDGDYGNAILTSLPIRSVRRIDISQDRREPRGALHIRLGQQDRPFDLLATHLGLRPGERRAQVKLLLQEMQNGAGSSNDSAFNRTDGRPERVVAVGQAHPLSAKPLQILPGPGNISGPFSAVCAGPDLG